MPSLLERAKAKAIKALKERQANPPKQIDNSSLYAGSMMYFYCKNCGHQSDCLPESYTTKPQKLCDACAIMDKNGWL